jgi:hypothetical protein
MLLAALASAQLGHTNPKKPKEVVTLTSFEEASLLIKPITGLSIDKTIAVYNDEHDCDRNLVEVQKKEEVHFTF